MNGSDNQIFSEMALEFSGMKINLF